MVSLCGADEDISPVRRPWRTDAITNGLIRTSDAEMANSSMMASPPVVHLNLNPTLGVTLVGLVLGSTFYGVTILQTIFYYGTYTKDHITLKLLVAVLWILDTLHLIFIAHALYFYLILNYANPMALPNMIWSMASEPLLTNLLAFIVHLFLAYRIRALNKKLTLVSIAVILVSTFLLALGIVTVYIVNTASVASSTQTLRWLAIVACTVRSGLDIVIAGILCHELYRVRTSFAPTRRMLSLLSTYLITSGVLTTLLNLAVMATFLASPSQLIFQLFNPCVATAYTSSLLATLNMRNTVRGRGASDDGMYAEGSAFHVGKNPGLSSSFAAGAPSRDYDIDMPPRGRYSESESESVAVAVAL